MQIDECQVTLWRMAGDFVANGRWNCDEWQVEL